MFRPLAVLLLWMAAGCTPQQSVAVKLVIDYRGASPAEVEETLAGPVEEIFSQPPEVVRIYGVSSVEGMDVYVVAQPGTDAQQLVDKVNQLVEQNLERLPAEARASPARFFPQRRVPPDYNIVQKPVLRVRLDRRKLAELGVSAADVQRMLEEAKEEIVASESVGGLSVPNEQGSLVPLSAVAEVEVELEPSHRVWSWRRSAIGGGQP